MVSSVHIVLGEVRLHVPISVIIPTFNRPRQLQACLAALTATTYPRDRFEVVVVDDGGGADLQPIIDAAHASLDVRLARQANGGPASARNAGAALARGALLAFTDDDCLPDPDWLPALARRAAAQPGHLIGGATVNVVETNPFSAASQHLVSYLYEYTERQRGNPNWTGSSPRTTWPSPPTASRGSAGSTPGSRSRRERTATSATAGWRQACP